MNAPVLFEERACTNGSRIGIATLNQPATLNGLSLDMVDLLAERLAAWEQDSTIALVVLRGAGEKAFCAGGDLHALYGAMKDGADTGYLAHFFEREYRLDHQIHTFAKPLLCWGHGIVMGGGMGLMAGASHRVVTEALRLAMPEIGIGLFPDVGGSWMLTHTPGHIGRFLALTGASVDAADALYIGFADHAVASHRYDELLDTLANTAWQSDAGADASTLDQQLQHFALAELPTGPVQRLRQHIDACCAGHSLETVVAALSAAEVDEVWWQKAVAGMQRGCPSSLRLAWEIQQRSSRLSLAEVFQLEYIAVLRCGEHGDIAEGIRALLIDKDKNPRWNPSTLTDADAAFIADFFTAPWAEGKHPLADLGKDDVQRCCLR